MGKVARILQGFKTKFVSKPVKKWAYNISGFNQYGLHHDDCLNEHHADVREAIRRLPLHLKCARDFRILRAMQLSMQHIVLPKCEWTKFEEDCKYLKPYLDEVRREKLERKYWKSY